MGQQWRRMQGIAVLLAVLPLLLAFPANAAAQGIYTSSWTGYDISWPQCEGVPPPANAYLFGVVGITSGHAFRNNPCFARQYAWATGPMAPESVYLNLNEDIGTTSPYGDTGPYGICHEGEACHALNYGYNAASSAFTYAAQQAPSFVTTMWWLDIETENSWSEDDLARNRDVIVGALRFLQMEHNFSVGIYSTEAMWQEITGSWQSAMPVWLGGGMKEDAKTHCGIGFTGGPVYLVQFPNGDYDGDYAC